MKITGSSSSLICSRSYHLPSTIYSSLITLTACVRSLFVDSSYDNLWVDGWVFVLWWSFWMQFCPSCRDSSGGRERVTACCWLCWVSDIPLLFWIWIEDVAYSQFTLDGCYWLSLQYTCSIGYTISCISWWLRATVERIIFLWAISIRFHCRWCLYYSKHTWYS